MAFLALDIGSGLTKYCTLKGECGDIISAVGQVTDPAGFTLGVPDHLQILAQYRWGILARFTLVTHGNVPVTVAELRNRFRRY